MPSNPHEAEGRLTEFLSHLAMNVPAGQIVRAQESVGEGFVPPPTVHSFAAAVAGDILDLWEDSDG